jgi:4-hydroxyproline epimerase
MKKIPIIDSHTGGEPTRVVLDGFPDLPQPTLAEKLRVLRTQHDHYRAAVCTEPPAASARRGGVGRSGDFL